MLAAIDIAFDDIQSLFDKMLSSERCSGSFNTD
jgi:hypothetical protein